MDESNLEVVCDSSTVVKLWKKVAKSEQQLKLIKNCMNLNVALNEVDKMSRNMVSQTKSSWGINREKKITDDLTCTKLKDAEKTARDVECQKRKLRQQVHNTFGGNSKSSKNMLRRARYEAEIETRAAQEKNENKLKFLFSKKEEREKRIKKINMEGLEEYSKLSIFQEGYEMVNNKKRSEYDKGKEPLMSVGVELDSDEEALLRLSP